MFCESGSTWVLHRRRRTADLHACASRRPWKYHCRIDSFATPAEGRKGQTQRGVSGPSRQVSMKSVCFGMEGRAQQCWNCVNRGVLMFQALIHSCYRRAMAPSRLCLSSGHVYRSQAEDVAAPRDRDLLLSTKARGQGAPGGTALALVPPEGARRPPYSFLCQMAEVDARRRDGPRAGTFPARQQSLQELRSGDRKGIGSVASLHFVWTV